MLRFTPLYIAASGFSQSFMHLFSISLGVMPRIGTKTLRYQKQVAGETSCWDSCYYYFFLFLLLSEYIMTIRLRYYLVWQRMELSIVVTASLFLRSVMNYKYIISFFFILEELYWPWIGSPPLWLTRRKEPPRTVAEGMRGARCEPLVDSGWGSVEDGMGIGRDQVGELYGDWYDLEVGLRVLMNSVKNKNKKQSTQVRLRLYE